MAQGYSYCPADLPAYLAQNCEDWRTSGISAVAIELPGSTIADYENASEWQENIDNGKVVIIGPDNVKAEWPEGSAVEVENRSACGNESIITGYNQQVNIQDSNVNSTNDAFYAELPRTRSSNLILFYCDNGTNGEIRVINQRISYSVSNPISELANGQIQRYNIQARFFNKVGKQVSTLYDAPEGIFE